MDLEKTTERKYLTKKVLASAAAITTILGMVAAIFAFDDRYAKGDDLEKLEKAAVSTFAQFEAAQSAKIERSEKLTKIQILQLKHQWIVNQLSDLRMKLSEDKNNTLLMTEYQNLLRTETILKKQIDDNLK